MGHTGSALDAAAGVWLDWMTRMSWQVAVLVAVVLAISLLARKASARFRYLLWCLVLLKLCLPPGIAFVTGIGQWFPLTPEAPLQTSTVEALPAPTLGEFVPGPSYQTAPFAEAPAVLPHSLHVSWPKALFGVWLVGLLGMMGLLARQYLRLRRHLSGSAPVEDAQVLDAFRQAREAIGVGSRVRLLTSAGLSSPILVGLVRPRIMLPAGALEDLPPDQLRPVFLHELSHLRRRDLWVNWIQVILQSLYWFHPLVWLANLRLRREREMIVDDVVLSHLGGEREVYGNSLLSVVKQAARKRVLSPGYVGIVETKGSIAGRLRRILDANRKLSIRLGWLSAAALIALALLLIPQARPEFEAPAKAQEPKAEETPAAAAPQWKATLPGGVTVELVGVSHYPSEGQPWWRPDGSATAERPYDRWVGFGSVWSGEAEREKAYNRSFALRIGGLESIFGRAVVHRVEPTGLSKGTTAPQSGGKDLQNMYAIAAALPEGAETCTIRFGLAGDWTTLMEHDGKAWTRHKTQECGEVALAQAEKADGGTRIAVSHHMPDDQDARLVAEDNQGGIHASREEKLHPSPQIVLFDNLQPADIRYFRLEVRPFRWVEFRNVSLEPGHKTDVEVVVEPPWGEAVDGVQVRLRADKKVWNAGEVPTFKADVRNVGGQIMSVPRRAEGKCQLELDGRWRYWPLLRGLLVRSDDLAPGAMREGMRVSLGEQLVSADNPPEPFRLGSGKHTVRLAISVSFPPGPRGEQLREPVRAVSNPVEIEIVGQITFLGLDLTDAPRTTKAENLPDLWEERPPGSKSYEMRAGVLVGRGPDHLLSDRVYYVPDKDVFYVRHDPLYSSTWTFYGPFEGKPWERLGIPESETHTVPQPSGAGAVTFGRVIERVVDYGPGRESFIDFESGGLFASPSDIDSAQANVRHARLVERRIDAEGQAYRDSGALGPVDLMATPVPAEWWETEPTMSYQELSDRVTVASPLVMMAGEEVPATFLFKTREGGMGILQIVGFTEDPPGVKIRYKMVYQAAQPEAKEGEPPSGAAAEGVQTR